MKLSYASARLSSLGSYAVGLADYESQTMGYKLWVTD